MGDSTADHAEQKKILKNQSVANSFSMESSGISVAAPQYQPSASNISSAPVQMQKDTQQGHFGDEENRVMTESGILANNPEFDRNTMKDVVSTAEFTGAGDKDLREAMTALQGSRDAKGNLVLPQGEELDKALATIAEVRGLDMEKVQGDYAKAMDIKRQGEAHAAKSGHDDVSPELDTTKHPDFMGSTGQLRFGMIMGDVFDVDPVFGALISPTGGAVGPGNKSISTWDKNNPIVMHGSVHDAAGYLNNAHGVGPGYNYLKSPYEFFDTDNPLSGQMTGVNYWTGKSNNGLLSDGWDAVKGGAKSLWNGAKGLASDAWGGIKKGASGLWNGAKGLASDAWGGIKSGASGLWNGAKGLAGDAWSGAKNLWGGAKDAASSAWGGLKSGASSLWGGAKDAAGSAWGGLKGLAGDAWGGAKSLWGSAKDKAGSLWGGAKDAASSAWGGIKGLAGDAWGGAKSLWGSAKDTAGSLWGGAKDAAGSAWGGLKGLAGDAWGGAKSLWGGAKDAAGSAWGGLKSGASSLWGGAKDAASGLWGGLKSGASSLWGGAKDAAGSAWGGIKGLAGDAWGGAKSLWGSAKDKAGSLWGGAKDKAGSLWGGVKDLWGKGKDKAGDLWGGAKDAASSAWGGAKGLASDAWGGVKNFFGKNEAKKVKQTYGSKYEGDGFGGPQAYLNEEKGGYTGGFGLASANAPGNSNDYLAGSFHAGKTKDPDNAGHRYGIGGQVGVAKGKYDIPAIINSFAPGTIPPGYIAELEAGLGTASVDAWLNPDSGASLGAQANYGEIAGTVGTEGLSDKDRTARFGVSAGAGAAGRLHWADKDGDGNREYGFGFDAGPFSVDVKTEDPVRDLLFSTIPGGGMLSDHLIGGNMTNDTIGLAKDAWGGAKGLAGDAWGGAKDLWGGAKSLWGDAKSGAKNLWGGAKGLASDAWGGAKSGAKSLWNGAKGLAGDAWGGAKSGAKKAWGGAKKLGGKALGGAKKAWSGAKGLANSAWGGAKKLGGKAKSGAKKAWGGAKSAASSGWKKFKSLW